ncbi:DUF2726 domain-containing protein [Pelagicoccus sp. SDUM812005]|uniref:DUF2726 domain-containing protein n=1 Tax=Pelagicoccus sp. SDUM812005 TaxID=3041257 RepID=UPI00280C6213|nr:DUF2726 domain-containing protein [Pelagicoccus sp. SDUM812005]MDQ8183747.1 DUF2726 domain-containing protein [Pelagicoccus sp. SDUM812005]
MLLSIIIAVSLFVLIPLGVRFAARKTLNSFIEDAVLAAEKTEPGRAPRPSHELAGQFEAKAVLLSPAEQRFHQELKAALRPGHEISCKVRLEDVFQVKRGLSDKRQRHSLRNRIKSRHLDFVVTNAADSLIVSLVELDDASHRSQKAQATDRFKDELARVSGLKLHRFPARARYAATDIQASLYGDN